MIQQLECKIVAYKNVKCFEAEGLSLIHSALSAFLEIRELNRKSATSI